jgi:hypothetical protein
VQLCSSPNVRAEGWVEDELKKIFKTGISRKKLITCHDIVRLPFFKLTATFLLRINSSIQQVKDIKPNKSHTPRL